jgi:hypothetical protein
MLINCPLVCLLVIKIPFFHEPGSYLSDLSAAIGGGITGSKVELDVGPVIGFVRVLRGYPSQALTEENLVERFHR